MSLASSEDASSDVLLAPSTGDETSGDETCDTLAAEERRRERRPERFYRGTRGEEASHSAFSCSIDVKSRREEPKD